MQVTFEEWIYIIVIYACCGLSIAYAVVQAIAIRNIDIKAEVKNDNIGYGGLKEKLLADKADDGTLIENTNTDMESVRFFY